MLEIRYVALPSGPLPIFTNQGPRVQNGLTILIENNTIFIYFLFLIKI